MEDLGSLLPGGLSGIVFFAAWLILVVSWVANGAFF